MPHDTPASPPAQPADPARRRLLSRLAAAPLAAGATGLAHSSAQASAPLPDPQDSGIDHIVVVMMENRSFDHILGWLPGADGRQAGRQFADTAGTLHSSFPLARDPAFGYQGCGWADPKHGYDDGRTDFNQGAMDGFLRPQPLGDTFPIGYYEREDVPFYSACADHWTICDAYHTAILGPTFPNRIYMHAGQTDRKSNTLALCRLPTIWDSLIAAGLPCRYYYTDAPVIALWGARYFRTHPIAQPVSQFVADFTAPGAVPPAVSYLDPYMLGEGAGTSWDDHPFADVRNGQAFLNYVYTVLTHSPAWPRTLLIINYDEWGGFFDHVPPGTAPVTPEEYAATGNDGRLGIRVPCVAIGPRARRGHVARQAFDPNSILNFISWRFGLAPLGARGDSSTNFAQALDFGQPPRLPAPRLAVPAGPFMLQPPYTPPRPGSRQGAFGGACRRGSAEAERRQTAHENELRELQALARRYGAQF